MKNKQYIERLKQERKVKKEQNISELVPLHNALVEDSREYAKLREVLQQSNSVLQTLKTLADQVRNAVEEGHGQELQEMGITARPSTKTIRRLMSTVRNLERPKLMHLRGQTFDLTSNSEVEELRDRLNELLRDRN